MPALRDRSRSRKADDTSADHSGINSFHVLE